MQVQVLPLAPFKKHMKVLNIHGTLINCDHVATISASYWYEQGKYIPSIKIKFQSGFETNIHLCAFPQNSISEAEKRAQETISSLRSQEI